MDLTAVISSLISILLTGWLTWRQTKSHQEDRIRALQVSEHQLQQQLTLLQGEKAKLVSEQTSLQQERDSLRPLAEGYRKARAALQASRVVRTYRQPVLLLGPRSVGKSSL